MSDLHKLTGAYAMDALDELERARFEQHLAQCDDCRAEVAELRETAALLSETVAVPPPASLRDSVLAGISQVRPLAPEVTTTATPTSTPTATPVATPQAAPARSGKPAGRRGWAPFLVAAALALFVGLGAMIVAPWADDDEVPRLTAAEQVLQAPDAEEVFLDLGEAGRATVVRSKSQDKAVIVTEDMVSAPEGKDYELWFQTPEDDMVPAGLMPDAPDQTVVLDGSAAEAVAVGITVEPEGGSEQPTSDPIALFDLTEAT
ncbi:anti-sigma factor [Nocardioides ganghwensis]|uniref:Regulator of SigK n=1 Tax=Nocardioides ganghwensis TaxID=252230 RepID=A0A4Q2SI71_9ACTN|nr:anti-sigma factor [Nocardioides ganghwensis]MBD3944942.1 anti-sigma factor [Nocardioides ganghwensis]RYC05052.1 anti-sigma factor [Nocardioides ganghwensis]